MKKLLLEIDIELNSASKQRGLSIRGVIEMPLIKFVMNTIMEQVRDVDFFHSSSFFSLTHKSHLLNTFYA